jgi:hypothetical protein
MLIDTHRAGRKRIPQTARHVRLAGGRRQRKVRLIRLIADRSVTEFVFVIAGRRHPRTVACAAAVVRPEVPPRAHAIFGEIGITQVAVEEVKRRPQPLDTERGVGAGRAAEIIVDVGRIRNRDTGRRRVAFAERRRALIAEARERERHAALRHGAERSELRFGTVMQRRVEIGPACCERRQLGVIGIDGPARLCIDVTRLSGRDGSFELPVQTAKHDARMMHRRERVPRSDHLR